jgi:Transposase DDE domain
MRVPDSAENREAFGGQHSHRGDSGYPQVRVVAAMALRSHILSAFRFADYHTGEVTLARDLWNEMPEDSLAIFDRNFLVKGDFIRFETSGNKHWLSRSKTNTKWAVIEHLGKDDDLVVLEVNEPGFPTTWELRAIHYKLKGFPRATLLTSLLDAKKYPAKELVAMYHERWETELGYDEVKTHLLDREETIRSRSPEGVRQELWGIAIAYNLIRLEMERAAKEANVPPTRISFMAAMALIKDEISRLRGASLALGTIPARLKDLRRNLKRLVLPERRTERAYPRAVKIKMSNYPRKRPTPRTRPVK